MSTSAHAAALAAFTAKKVVDEPPRRPTVLRVNTDLGRQKSTAPKSAAKSILTGSISRTVPSKLPSTKGKPIKGKSDPKSEQLLAAGAAIAQSVTPTNIASSGSAIALAAGKAAAESNPTTPNRKDYVSKYQDLRHAQQLPKSPDAPPIINPGGKSSITSNSDIESTYSRTSVDHRTSPGKSIKSVQTALAAASAALCSSITTSSTGSLPSSGLAPSPIALGSSLAAAAAALSSSMVSSSIRPRPDTNRRISHGPQDMIKQVKESINANKVSLKALTDELTLKNQALLDGLRKSIDLKRITSNLAFQSTDDVRRHSGHSSFFLPSNGSAYAFDAPMNGSTSSHTEDGVFIHPFYNQSYSSLESGALLPSFAKSGTPITVVAPELPDTSSPYRAEELPRQNLPIQIPSSPLVAARTFGSSEALSQRKIEKTVDDNKQKPKRKPPPGTFDAPLTPKEEFFKDGFSDNEYLKRPGILSPQSGYFLSKSLVGHTDEYEFSSDPGELEEDDQRGLQRDLGDGSEKEVDSDFATLVQPKVPHSSSFNKFPQFPDIHRKAPEHLFKRKHKSTGSTSVTHILLGSEVEDESDLDFQDDLEGFSSSTTSLVMNGNSGGSGSVTPSRSLAPPLPQTLRMKTTMRKTNRRKDKKTAFNENKPWKNHTQLNYITDLERKRYEGVWVSNRGSYINSVVTELHGVDFEKMHNPLLDKEKEVEVPLKAALLSSQAKFFDPKSVDDHNNFHNINAAEVQDLMHGLVVKRIWRRSRLPSETLAIIWSLVDYRRDGTLNKPEFLVGMWLVDQCLYGRKIPTKVESAIWDSLRSIGVSVVIKKKGRR